MNPRQRGDHLFRSRMQRPVKTCNLSMDGANPWVHVRGCPWSSAAVDVPTDVDREALRSRPLTGGLPAAKHLILGQELLPQPLHSDHGYCMPGLGGIPSAWHSPTTRCPGGNIPPHRRPNLPCLPPGHRVVALGEVDGMPPSPPARLNARVSPSRRPAGVRGGERPRWFRYLYPALRRRQSQLGAHMDRNPLPLR
jgi:hypothetical protein